MNRNIYHNIIDIIHNHKGHFKELQNILKDKYPNFSNGTISSIISNECQKLTRRCNHKNTEYIDKLFNIYMENREIQEEIFDSEMTNFKLDHKKILKMSQTFRIPPTLIAKVILNKFYETENGKLSKKNITDMTVNSCLIDDSDLSLEVYWCTLYDDEYSPSAECLKQQLGYEYECKLRSACVKENMAFKDERVLRKEGYDKTPDIKLEVPVLINGLAITWIESKARFADDEIHQGYMRDQYLSYFNRWGPGLIIYWFGFTEDVTSEKQFIILDHFPESDKITHLNSSQDMTEVISEFSDNLHVNKQDS